jgi:hypothetical protein
MGAWGASDSMAYEREPGRYDHGIVKAGHRPGDPANFSNQVCKFYIWSRVPRALAVAAIGTAIALYDFQLPAISQSVNKEITQ